MVIEFFQLPQKGQLSNVFGKLLLKVFSKTCGMPPFLVTKNLQSPFEKL
jgi:hypothetical protein